MRRLASLAAIYLMAQAPAWAGGSDQLRHFLNATLAAKGSFTQTVIAQQGRKPKESSGSFALQRPGKFRWNYEAPYPLLLVSDGQTLWSYDADLKQAVAKKLGAGLGASPAALLAGGDIEKHFDLKDAGTQDGLEWVEARPKRDDAGFASMRMGLARNLPVAMEIHDNFGQVTLLRFQRVESNPTLAAESFRFKPPAGVDLLQE